MITVQHNLVLSADLLGFLLSSKYLVSHPVLKFGPLLVMLSTVLIQSPGAESLLQRKYE